MPAKETEEPRKVRLHFVVTPGERERIYERMEAAGVRNFSAYMRKMALDGYIIHLDLSDVREMVSLLRRTSNNFNQIARRVNQGGGIYATDVEGLGRKLDQLWDAAGRIMGELAKVT